MDVKKLFQQYLVFVKRYIPEPKKESLIGIDAGYSTCKMVEVKPVGNSYELVRWGIEPVSEDGQSGAIKKLLAKIENPERAFASAVHGKGTLIRYVELPRMSQDELKKSFAYEADKYLPFTSDQVYLDCLILDPKSHKNKMSVMIAAAKKEIIDERIELFKALGISIDFISLNPIAIANVINTLAPLDKAGTEGKQEASAIIDIGEKVTNINIIYKGFPRFTRDIFIAGEDFTRQIANTLRVSMDEAQRLKRDAGDQKEGVTAACESVAMNLISDTRLSLDYFVTEHNIPVTKIFLSGGTPFSEGVRDLFKNYFEIEVALWDPFENIIVPDDMREELKKISGQLGVALGLSLYS